MRKPNFFILGAPKCGTTSLSAWLDDHPNIFMSQIKEPGYFDTDTKKVINFTLKEYEALFEGAEPQHELVGEATTNYLYSQTAVPNILDYVENSSELKFIVAIRNPIEMTVSLHAQRLRTGREVIKDFSSAWNLQAERREGRSIPPFSDAESLMYGPICSVGEQIERLYQRVKKEQVYVVVLERIIKNPRLEYTKILEFLELPDNARENFPLFNEAATIPLWIAFFERVVIWFKGFFSIRKGIGLIKLLNKKIHKPGGKVSLNQETYQLLNDYFKKDILLLSKLTGYNFTNWLEREWETQ